ncbi:UNVERIFIED_CONTAM: Protein CASC1 [Trichonephila clavipes]
MFFKKLSTGSLENRFIFYFYFQKLLSVGLNVAYDRKDYKFVGISPKNHKMEETIYNSMALLCSEYDFSRSKWNHELSPESIVMNYRKATPHQNEEDSLVLVRPDRVIRLKYGEEESSFSDEPADGQQFSGTLFNLVLNGARQTSERFITESCCIENVRLLLKKCGLVNCG